MKKTIIIAEGGVNHNGKNNAKKIISKAKKAGADYIKFQMYDADALSTSKANKADYQKNLIKRDERDVKKISNVFNQILDLNFARKKN